MAHNSNRDNQQQQELLSLYLVEHLSNNNNNQQHQHPSLYLVVRNSNNNNQQQQEPPNLLYLVVNNSNQEHLLLVGCLVIPHHSSNQVNHSNQDFSAILSNQNKKQHNWLNLNKVVYYSDNRLKLKLLQLNKEDFLVQQTLNNQILILPKPNLLLALYLEEPYLKHLTLKNLLNSLQEDYLELPQHKLPISFNLQFPNSSNRTPSNKINHKNKLLLYFLVQQLPNKNHPQHNRPVCFNHLPILLHNRIQYNRSKLLQLPIKLELPQEALKLPLQRVMFLLFLLLQVQQEGCLVVNLQNRLNQMVKVDPFRITIKLLHLIKRYLHLQVLLIHSLELVSKNPLNLHQPLNNHNQLQQTLQFNLLHSHNLNHHYLEEIIKLLILQNPLPHHCLVLLLNPHHNWMLLQDQPSNQKNQQLKEILKMYLSSKVTLNLLLTKLKNSQTLLLSQLVITKTEIFPTNLLDCKHLKYKRRNNQDKTSFQFQKKPKPKQVAANATSS